MFPGGVNAALVAGPEVIRAQKSGACCQFSLAAGPFLAVFSGCLPFSRLPGKVSGSLDILGSRVLGRHSGIHGTFLFFQFLSPLPGLPVPLRPFLSHRSTSFAPLYPYHAREPFALCAFSHTGGNNRLPNHPSMYIPFSFRIG